MRSLKVTYRLVDQHSGIHVGGVSDTLNEDPCKQVNLPPVQCPRCSLGHLRKQFQCPLIPCNFAKEILRRDPGLIRGSGRELVHTVNAFRPQPVICIDENLGYGASKSSRARTRKCNHLRGRLDRKSDHGAHRSGSGRDRATIGPFAGNVKTSSCYFRHTINYAATCNRGRRRSA